MSTKKEVVVITGASAGVGRATAIEFARRGARIGLLARGRAGLEGARRDVELNGGEALALPCRHRGFVRRHMNCRSGPLDLDDVKSPTRPSICPRRGSKH